MICFEKLLSLIRLLFSSGEVPKSVVLRHMQEELEICFKCLTQYLDKKRTVYPRFYFLTDTALLALLSRPNDIESVRPHLRFDLPLTLLRTHATV